MSLLGHPNTFQEVIDVIFNNWTGLKMTIEHNFNGKNQVVLQKLVNLINGSVAILDTDHLDSTVLSDYLFDQLETEFDVILEDDSADEIADHICQLFDLWRSGRHDEIWPKMSGLKDLSPITINFNIATVKLKRVIETEDKTGEEEATDSEWTVVKRR